jgi:DNA-binding NarL/FixJ family response regulator
MVSTRPRVLIADDYPDMVKAICRVLSLDCEVVGTVSDGSAVLEAAQRLQPDVIVVDVNLPNVNGLEACRQITDVNPKAKVIVFSAMDDPDLKQRCVEVGASAFVHKATGDGDLLSTVKRLCTTEVDETGSITLAKEVDEFSPASPFPASPLQKN